MFLYGSWIQILTTMGMRMKTLLSGCELQPFPLFASCTGVLTTQPPLGMAFLRVATRLTLNTVSVFKRIEEWKNLVGKQKEIVRGELMLIY